MNNQDYTYEDLDAMLDWIERDLPDIDMSDLPINDDEGEMT